MEQTAQVFGIIGLILAVLSIGLKLLGKKRLGPVLLLAAALSLALHSIHRDAYLHPWDERFHAVVALNAMEDPFHPKLIPEKLADNWPYDEWYAAHTWLHKQPLFTWQMALGMKIFGTSLAGMRSASVAMFLLLLACSFMAIRNYFPRSAYWILLLLTTSPTLLFFVNGRMGIDHNDIAFLAYIALSFWGLVSYTKTGKLPWLVMLGIGAGAAMLTKWLAGSLMLFVLGLHLLITRDFSRKSWLGLILAGAVALVVFLPWQIHAYVEHQSLYLKELDYNSRHLTEVLEGHEGSVWYHFKVWKERFLVLSLLAIGSLGLVFFLPRAQQRALLTCILSVLAVMIFYALAQTKMPAFTLILLPLIAFTAAAALEFLLSRFRYFVIPLLLAATGYFFYHNYVKAEEGEGFVDYQKRLRAQALEMKKTLPGNAVIFNAPQMMFVDYIFYTHVPVFEKLPNPELVEKLQDEGWEVYVLLRNDTELDSSLASRVHIVRAPDL